MQLTDKQINYLPMMGIEPQISGVGSDRSANCATTTAKLTQTFVCIHYVRQIVH